MADFTFSGYAALLDRFAELGYEVVDFESAAPEASHLILRHDIDLSVEAALPMAKLEAERGLAASYFVQIRSPLYNAFAAPSLDALRCMTSLGHTIGLHFDAALYGAAPAELDRAAARECETLEAMLGQSVPMISFHRPAPALQAREGRIAGRMHAYEPRFFREIGYCSDSRGAWCHGHPLDHAAVVKGKALQLLIHPLWWITPPGTPAAKLDRWFETRLAALDRDLAGNVGVHQPGRCRMEWSDT